MEYPPVSVVMSVFNGEKDLPKTIESILSQTFGNFEYIIIDDGSVDATPDILHRYSVDKRIKVIRQANTGLTKALIRGCYEARGKYIARIDVGDLSYPERLHRQVTFCDSDSRLVFCSCWARMVGPKGELLEEVKRSGDPETATHRLLNNREGPSHHGSVVMLKRAYEKVGGYRSQFYFGQDSDLWLRLAEKGLIGYVQEYLSEFKLEHSGLSFTKDNIRKKYIDIIDLCRRARAEKRSEELFLCRASNLQRYLIKGKHTISRDYKFYYFIGSILLRRGDASGSSYLFKSFHENPFYWKILLKMPYLAVMSFIIRNKR